MNNLKKGFTLIELLAVIVILSVLALVAIPIVINIIKESRLSTKQRSIDSYGRTVAVAMSNYMSKNDLSDYSRLLFNGTINSWEDFENTLHIEYSGSRVRCRAICISKDGVVALTQCAVGKDAANAIRNGNFIKNDNGELYSYTSGEPLNSVESDETGTSGYTQKGLYCKYYD